jgi:sortase A
MRRALRIVSTSLITAGVVIALDVALTLVWKEPLSTVYGSIQQGAAEDDLDELNSRFLQLPAVRSAHAAQHSPRAARRLADLFAEEVQVGEGIGRIAIESIDLDAVFVEGTDTASLRKGPGHYKGVGEGDGRNDGSAFPGQGRTVGIAGHRTTYLAPFRRIDDIERGDEVELEMPYGTFTYTVQKHEVVDPSDIEIVRDVGYDRLVLTACHPLFSAAQRWAVLARLSNIESAP